MSPTRRSRSAAPVHPCWATTQRFTSFTAALTPTASDLSTRRHNVESGAWRPKHFAFGVVGGYDLPRGKGQREFLQAAARISAQVPQARFLIVGRGNMDTILRADIERLGLAGKAWLTPYCRDMAAAMNALDCLVHPQVGTEAFPGVVLEAFACGKPVIASALDGIPEAFAVCRFGQLVSPNDVDALAQAMLEYAQRPAADTVERQRLHGLVEEGSRSRPAAAMWRPFMGCWLGSLLLVDWTIGFKTDMGQKLKHLKRSLILHKAWKRWVRKCMDNHGAYLRFPPYAADKHELILSTRDPAGTRLWRWPFTRWRRQMCRAVSPR